MISAAVVENPDLESIDITNDILVLSEVTIGSDLRVYGNAGAAAKVDILDVTLDNMYEGDSGDLVSGSWARMDPSGPVSAEMACSLPSTHWNGLADSSLADLPIGGWLCPVG